MKRRPALPGIGLAAILVVFTGLAHAEKSIVTRILVAEKFTDKNSITGSEWSVAVRGIAVERSTGRAFFYRVNPLCLKSSVPENLADILFIAALRADLDVTFVVGDTFSVPALDADGYNRFMPDIPAIYNYRASSNFPLRIEVPRLQYRLINTGPQPQCK